MHLNVSENELLVLESSINRELEHLKNKRSIFNHPELMIVTPANIEEQQKELLKQINLANLLRHKIAMLRN